MAWFDKVRFAPLLAQVVVTRRCNLSCGYCNEFDRISTPVPTKDLKRRISKLKSLGTVTVEFTGGEPMLHPDIASIVAYAKSVKIPLVMMISNAFLLTERTIRDLNNAGLSALQISVDGVEPNEQSVKTLKSIKNRLRLLAKMARFKVTLSCVYGTAETEEVREVMQFAIDHGFKPRILLLHGDDGQLIAGQEALADIKEIGDQIGRRFTEARDYRIRLAKGQKAPFKCRAGSRYLYVDEFGLVRWCSQQQEAFAKSLDDFGLPDLRQQFNTKKPCTDYCTIGCARTNSKIDEWRPQPL